MSGLAHTDSYTFAFPSLEMRLEATAGWHDGFQMVLSADSATDPSIAFHESVHDRIFMTTPDGRLLAALAGLRKTTSLPSDVHDAVSDAMDRILARSRWAHEVIATYCGLKLLSADAEPATVARLPSDYLDYYRTLHDRIDAHVRSRYLQFIVGWVIAERVFSSDMIAHVARDRAYTFSPSLIESNDDRLTALLPSLAPDELQPMLEAVRLRLIGDGHTLADIQSDDAWRTHVGSGIDKLEASAYAAVKDWLAGAALGVRMISRESLGDAIERMYGYLRHVGILADPSAVLDGLGLELDEQGKAEVVYLAGAEIDHPDSRVMERVHPDTPLGDLVDDPNSFVTLLSDADHDGSPDWTIFHWPASDAPEISAGRISHAVATRWLARRAIYATARQPIPQIQSIIASLVDKDDLTRVLAHVVESTGIHDGEDYSQLGLCWYLRGNWMAWVARFCRRAPSPPAMIWLQADAAPLASEADPLHFGGTWIGVLRVEGLPGTFMRIFNHYSFATVASVQNQLLRAGRLTTVPAQDQPQLVRDVVRAKGMIEQFWKRY